MEDQDRKKRLIPQPTKAHGGIMLSWGEYPRHENICRTMSRKKMRRNKLKWKSCYF